MSNVDSVHGQLIGGLGARFDERFDHSQYISITMEFRCNLKCVHCMIEGTMDKLQPQNKETFKKLLAHNKVHKIWKGLILTGSEITLMKDLPELAMQAKSSGFDHIRIQTHGMHLAQSSYCKKLIASGIDEYFVSVAGADAFTHDTITVVGGSFDKTIKGLENIDQYENAVSITNTVVTANSYRQLPEIVNRLRHLNKLIQMEFWVYWPMKERDEKNLIPSHKAVAPYLKEAIRLARGYGRRVEVKNFPTCMLGEYGDAVVNAQPELIIDPDFWDEFSRNGFYQCPYFDECEADNCLGLNTAYINTHGIETDVLKPIKRALR